MIKELKHGYIYSMYSHFYGSGEEMFYSYGKCHFYMVKQALFYLIGGYYHSSLL